MGRACSTYGDRTDGEIYTGFWWGNLGEEDPGVDWRIILKWIFEKRDESMEWIDLTQDRDRWRSLVNAVVNLRVPQHAGNFLSS
jgi:hypothetical protein